MSDIKILNEGSEYQTLEVGYPGKMLELNSKDKDGDVCVEFYGSSDNYTLYLNQEEIKAVIKHLQAQVVQE